MQLPPFMQNQKVQIGIIAVAVLIGLVALFTQILGSGNSGVDPSMGAYGPPGMPGAYGPPGAPNGPGGGPPGMPGAYGPPGGPPGYGGPTDTYGGGAPGTATASTGTTETKKAGPKPPRDSDPFVATTPAAARVVEAAATASMEPLPLTLAAGPTPPLYEAFRWQKAQEETVTGTAPESPDIPMRMAGVLWGPRVYGLLEVNGQVDSYTPGDTVATIYRVERIERDRMILSKRLSNGKRKQVEVPLAGSPFSQQGQYDPTGGAGGYPGAPGYGGGYPGAPGGPGAPPYGGPGLGAPPVGGP